MQRSSRVPASRFAVFLFIAVACAVGGLLVDLALAQTTAPPSAATTTAPTLKNPSTYGLWVLAPALAERRLSLHTRIVIITTVVFGFYLYGMDLILSWLLSFVLKS